MYEPGFGFSGPACRWGEEERWMEGMGVTRCDYDERGGLDWNSEVRTENREQGMGIECYGGREFWRVEDEDGVGVGDEGRMKVCSRITCGRPECELDFGR